MLEIKKRSLKSIALAVKGGWEVPGDQWCGMVPRKSHTGAAEWGVGSHRWPEWLCCLKSVKLLLILSKVWLAQSKQSD